MPYAITLRLSASAAEPIERIWRALAEQTGNDSIVQLAYPPHLTLAVLPDDVPAKAIEDATFDAVDGWAALPIVLAGIGVFPASSSTIWAVPAVTEQLLAHHGRLLAALSAFPIHPHYQVGAWGPHVTLSQPDSATASRALEIAASLWNGPIIGWLDRVELARFRPVQLLRSAPLSVPSGQ